MATKSKDVPVKKGGETGAREMAPASGAQSPVSGLHGELDRVFNRFFADDWPRFGLRRWTESDPFRAIGGTSLENMLKGARADISETDTRYEISVELPGIDEKDIELDLSEGTLTLSAEKREEHEEKKKNYHLSERSYGSVWRSFQVPDGVDTDKIKADFSKGVLRVVLPKSKEAKEKQRRIPVKGG